ncbi:hypothetical protein EVAR_51524_1 [Eumeta japonica]|uniref:Uncharacterized protein n=1 Tax=Eumeta variegata TaxID=151549 RepID=A0A4C1XAU3_EUMVA|nr:hypothetical protein EVAR_51524_1 [Eumeta japonica]
MGSDLQSAEAEWVLKEPNEDSARALRRTLKLQKETQYPRADVARARAVTHRGRVRCTSSSRFWHYFFKDDVQKANRILQNRCRSRTAYALFALGNPGVVSGFLRSVGRRRSLITMHYSILAICVYCRVCRDASRVRRHSGRRARGAGGHPPVASRQHNRTDVLLLVTRTLTVVVLKLTPGGRCAAS